MKKIRSAKAQTIPTRLIAPCGMNCRLCHAYIRDKNVCPGCSGDNRLKSTYCIECKIKNCDKLTKRGNSFCFNCKSFPCKRLKNLDKRYRKKYGMSMIENLEIIREAGIRYFIKKEKQRRACPECGDLICVHKPKCFSCGYKWQ